MSTLRSHKLGTTMTQWLRSTLSPSLTVFFTSLYCGSSIYIFSFVFRCRFTASFSPTATFQSRSIVQWGRPPHGLGDVHYCCTVFVVCSSSSLLILLVLSTQKQLMPLLNELFFETITLVSPSESQMLAYSWIWFEQSANSERLWLESSKAFTPSSPQICCTVAANLLLPGCSCMAAPLHICCAAALLLACYSFDATRSIVPHYCIDLLRGKLNLLCLRFPGFCRSLSASLLHVVLSYTTASISYNYWPRPPPPPHQRLQRCNYTCSL